MDKLNQKYSTLIKALDTLQDSIEYYNECEAKTDTIEKKAELAARDSVIQRFEYCVDLFWKLLKIYLEQVEKVNLLTSSPRGIIREATSAKIISEAESIECMRMVNERNQTSHIYHFEIAEQIAGNVPRAYQTIKTIVDRLMPRY